MNQTESEQEIPWQLLFWVCVPLALAFGVFAGRVLQSWSKAGLEKQIAAPYEEELAGARQEKEALQDKISALSKQTVGLQRALDIANANLEQVKGQERPSATAPMLQPRSSSTRTYEELSLPEKKRIYWALVEEEDRLTSGDPWNWQDWMKDARTNNVAKRFGITPRAAEKIAAEGSWELWPAPDAP